MQYVFASAFRRDHLPSELLLVSISFGGRRSSVTAIRFRHPSPFISPEFVDKCSAIKGDLRRRIKPSLETNFKVKC